MRPVVRKTRSPSAGSRAAASASEPAQIQPGCGVQPGRRRTTQRHARRGARGHGVGGHRRREGVGGVDDRRRVVLARARRRARRRRRTRRSGPRPAGRAGSRTRPASDDTTRDARVRPARAASAPGLGGAAEDQDGGVPEITVGTARPSTGGCRGNCSAASARPTIMTAAIRMPGLVHLRRRCRRACRAAPARRGRLAVRDDRGRAVRRRRSGDELGDHLVDPVHRPGAAPACAPAAAELGQLLAVAASAWPARRSGSG